VQAPLQNIEKQRAYDFERYLKSSSGYAFTKKRLI